MKFGNGCWLQKEGCECFAPKQAYETQKEERVVELYAPTAHIQHRGDTLGGVGLTVRITSPMPQVLRVQVWHHRGARQQGPSFELAAQDVPLQVQGSEKEISMSSGSLSLNIRKDIWRMEYRRDDEPLTMSVDRDLACMKTNWRGFAYDRSILGETYMRQQLGLSV